jgi:hypothetical protein
VRSSTSNDPVVLPGVPPLQKDCCTRLSEEGKFSDGAGAGLCQSLTVHVCVCVCIDREVVSPSPGAEVTCQPFTLLLAFCQLPRHVPRRDGAG